MEVRKGLLDILKGNFLVSGAAPKNWIFIIFASFLATVMIASAHGIDKKVYEIAVMNERVKELRSEFVEVRSDVQRLKLESTVMLKIEGLYPSENPPIKIKVTTEEE